MHRKAIRVTSMRRMVVLFFPIHYLIFVFEKVVPQKWHLQNFIPLNNAEFQTLGVSRTSGRVLCSQLGKAIPWWLPKNLLPDMGENQKKKKSKHKNSPKLNKIKAIQQIHNQPSLLSHVPDSWDLEWDETYFISEGFIAPFPNDPEEL